MKKIINKYYIYFIFAIYFLICLIRATKGFCWSDESFYFSMTDRFFKGDMPMRDEWWRAQMSSVFCLPFYSLYVLITGSNAGIILYFRVLYVISTLILSIVAYKIIGKHYPTSVSLVIATLIMFYSHLNIATFSYYMLSVISVLLTLLMIYDYYDTNSKVELIIAGFSFAISVLSLPTLVIVYFIIMALVGLAIVVSLLSFVPLKIKSSIKNMRLPQVSLYTIIGIAIPAIIVVVYLLINMSISDLIKSIPFVLSDKEHSYTIMSAAKKFFTAVRDVYGKYTYICAILAIIALCAQKWIKNTIASDAIVIADILIYIVLAIKSYSHTGYIQSVLVLTLIPLFFLSNKKNHRLFWLFAVGGATLAMTYSVSSNGQLYILAIGHFIMAIACICASYDYFSSKDEINKVQKVSALFVSLMILYACCVTFSLRMVNVYRDAPVNKLNGKITVGPAKGLYTTEEHLTYYNTVCDTIDKHCTSATNNSSDKIMFSKICPWGYMYTDLKCAMPTTWRTNSYLDEQFMDYYNYGMHSMPDIILVLDEEYGSYDACGDVEDDHNPNLDEMSEYWLSYIKDNNMVATPVDCGVLYK